MQQYDWAILSGYASLETAINDEGGEGGLCISSSQVCDGQIDCVGGEDESKETCSSWLCEHGVRCWDSECALVHTIRICAQVGKRFLIILYIHA